MLVLAVELVPDAVELANSKLDESRRYDTKYDNGLERLNSKEGLD